MKRVAMVVGRDFQTYNMCVKFALRDETGDLIIYGFPLIEDTKLDYHPFHASTLEKIQLTQLKQFIDEALAEIEKEEKENDDKNI